MLSVDYSDVNLSQTKTKADAYFELATKTNSEQKRIKYLKKSAAEYYILINASAKDINSCVKLARIYDLQKNASYAKAYFYQALGLNPKNPEANYYFGEYYYSRNNFTKALEYYDKALRYGISQGSGIYEKMAAIYARLGDIRRAENFYKRAAEYKK